MCDLLSQSTSVAAALQNVTGDLMLGMRTTVRKRQSLRAVAGWEKSSSPRWSCRLSPHPALGPRPQWSRHPPRCSCLSLTTHMHTRMHTRCTPPSVQLRPPPQQEHLTEGWQRECLESPCLLARGSEGSQVAEKFTSRPVLHMAVHQGPTDSGGGLAHKGEWADGSAPDT